MPADAPLRIVVGEDEPLVREGIVSVLQRAGLEVVAVAADAPGLIQQAALHHPDVVVTDIQMPPTSTDDGVAAAKTIRADQPGVGVLVLSQFLEPHYALELLADGTEGIGYLLKDRVADLGVFVEAVRRVANGESALDPHVVRTVVERPRAAGPLDRLTPRERDVLALMAEGRSNQGIADVLVVSVAAVERHVTSIFMKLDLPQTATDHRRVLAVLRYLGT